MDLNAETQESLEKILQTLEDAQPQERERLWEELNKQNPDHISRERVPENGTNTHGVNHNAVDISKGSLEDKETSIKLEADSQEKEHPVTISKMRLSKLSKFQKGNNFARFCERFQEYSYLTKMQDDNLHLFFLQHVDDATYSTLKPIKLTDSEKRDPERFCNVYKDVIYGDQNMAMKNEFFNCKQKLDEDISDFVCRLRDKASIAFEDEKIADDNCLQALCRGVKNKYIKRKLNESNLENVNDAIKLAKRLEKVETMLSDESSSVASILKSTQLVNFEEKAKDDTETKTFPGISGESRKDQLPDRCAKYDYSNKHSSSPLHHENSISRSPSPYRSRQRYDNGDSSQKYDRNRSRNRFRSSSPRFQVSNTERSRFQTRNPSESWQENENHHRTSIHGRDNPKMGDNQYNNNFRSLNRRTTKVCYFCHTPGHVMRSCWKTLNLQNREKQMQNQRRPRHSLN